MRIHDIVIFFFSYISVNSEADGTHDCVESCKKGEQERLGEHCYYWSTWRGSWDYARLACEGRNGLNGSLAAVTSMEIHNFLMTKVDKEDRNTWYWIGGSHKEEEGTWKWEDGSEWNFTNWASQPNQQPNGADSRDCLQIYHPTATNGWNDHFCNDIYLFICSWRVCSGHICPYCVVIEIFLKQLFCSKPNHGCKCLYHSPKQHKWRERSWCRQRKFLSNVIELESGLSLLCRTRLCQLYLLNNDINE